MMAEPAAIWSGSFELSGVEIKCHVLDNGQRIVDVDSVERLVDFLAEGTEFEEEQLKAFMSWLAGR